MALLDAAAPGTGPGPEAPVALLDAAAVETVRRRAGLRPARAAERRGPPDPRPPLPPAAARRTSRCCWPTAPARPAAAAGAPRPT
ncbi:hypothetical protein SVIOM74S_06576 [Streptomyces violarus]